MFPICGRVLKTESITAGELGHSKNQTVAFVREQCPFYGGENNN